MEFLVSLLVFPRASDQLFYCVHHDLCGVSWYIVQNHFALRREKSAISFFSFFFFFFFKQ